jgi:hypothetical protein
LQNKSADVLNRLNESVQAVQDRVVRCARAHARTSVTRELAHAQTAWQARIAAWKTATVATVVSGCNAVCNNASAALNMGQLNDLQTCQALCNNITTVADVWHVGRWIGKSQRIVLEGLLASNQLDSAAFNASRDALREAIGVQRALLNGTRGANAVALDAKKAQLETLRETRAEARANVTAAFADFSTAFAAATTADAKHQVLAALKANLTSDVASATAALQAARVEWQGARAAWLSNVTAFNTQRQDNRKIIIADVSNLDGTIADILSQCQDANANCSIVDTTSSATRKRTAGTPSYTLIASCNLQDPTCDQQLNTIMAGSTPDSSSNVNEVDTSVDEMQYTDPTLPADPAPSAGAHVSPSLVLLVVCGALVSVRDVL